MFSYIDPTDLSQVGFYTTHDTRPGFLAEVGMAMPAVVAETSAETDEFYVTRSVEDLGAFDDVDIFVTYGDAEGTLLDKVTSDPVLSQIPAIERGSVAVLEESTPLAASANPSPLSIGWGDRRLLRPPGRGRRAASVPGRHARSLSASHPGTSLSRGGAVLPHQRASSPGAAWARHGLGPPLIQVSVPCWFSHLHTTRHSPVWRHFLDEASATSPQ